MSIPDDPGTAPMEPPRGHPPGHYPDPRAGQPDPRERYGDSYDTGMPPGGPPGYGPPPGMYGDQRGYGPDPRERRRDSRGISQEAARFAQRHIYTPETKEFFKTSEFFLTVIAAIILIIAASVQDTFDAPQMWRLFTALVVAYVLSRGIAKAGSRKSDSDGR
jgi:hypothetical protein